jgi:hypothetical protein
MQVWGHSNVANLPMQNKGEEMLSYMPEGEGVRGNW